MNNIIKLIIIIICIILVGLINKLDMNNIDKVCKGDEVCELNIMKGF